MFSATCRKASCSTSRLVHQTSKASIRRASSSALAKDPSTEASTPRPTYLNAERKRQLTSLYHETETFVTLENLSSYIDNQFAVIGGGTSLDPVREDGLNELGVALAKQQSQPKTTIVSAGNNAFNFSSFVVRDRSGLRNVARDIKEEREEKVKKAVYGVDESRRGRASFEMAQKRMEEGSSKL